MAECPDSSAIRAGLGYVVLFCYYLCNFFVIFFFNSALVAFVVARMRGEEPTLAASLRDAATCLPQIAVWAVVASTVGIVLKMLEARAGSLGRIVIASSVSAGRSSPISSCR